jgi:hypothetical protein
LRVFGLQERSKRFFYTPIVTLRAGMAARAQIEKRHPHPAGSICNG